MPVLAIFGISVALSFVGWGIFATQYLWPALRKLPRASALRPLLLFHSFRFVGLAFVVPGVVAPNLPDAFARPAAYGDLIAAVLALFALAGLSSRLNHRAQFSCTHVTRNHQCSGMTELMREVRYYLRKRNRRNLRMPIAYAAA